MTKETKALMLLKKETADIVLQRVQKFQDDKELDLPPKYSAANALKSAWLILQETTDKNKNPVLSVCNKTSIANALLDMVIQGLNPAKDQCYFIAYGKSLTLQRSYHGSLAVAYRVAPNLGEIFAEVIYEGDEVEITIDRGQRMVTNHTQRWENIDNTKIQGAYATAISKDGDLLRSELMTLDQLKKAWSQSRMKPVEASGKLKPGTTHEKFTDEMARKTVINRLTKRIINVSTDADLVLKSVERQQIAHAEAEAEEEIAEQGNTEVIDISPQASITQQQEAQKEGAEVDAEWVPTDEEKAEIEAQERAEAEGPGF
jgi:recombination protein RecT